MSNNFESKSGLLRRAFQPLNSPGNIAFAIMFGIGVGVMPKFSLLPWGIGVIALLLPLNLATFAVTAAVLSFAGHLLDPWFHEIGLAVLTDPSLQKFLQPIAQSDSFVWLQLNNTVVAGSLVAWAVALLPGYFICRAFIFAIAPSWNRVLGSFARSVDHRPVTTS